MNDKRKTKAQLIAELNDLRQQLAHKPGKAAVSQREDGTVEEATPPKRAQTLIEQQAEDLRLISQLNNAVNRGDQLPQIYQLLSQELTTVFATLEAAVFLLDDSKTNLVMQNSRLNPAITTPIEHWVGVKIPQITIPVSPTMPYGQVLSSGQSILLDTPESIKDMIKKFIELPVYRHWSLPPITVLVKGIYAFLGVKSIIAAPLFAKKQVMGLLAVSSTDFFSRSDISRIEAIALQLTNIINRKQTESRLREERQLLRTLIDNLPDHIYVKDTQHRFMINNLAHVRSLGKKFPEEVVGLSDLDLYPSELATEYQTDEKRVFETGQTLTKPGEKVINQSTGEQSTFLVTKVPLRDRHNNIAGLVGISRDITSLKQTQQELERLLVAERQQRLMAETLREVTLALASQTHPVAVLDEILLQAERLVPYAAASIMLLDDNALKLARSRGFEKFYPPGALNRFSLPLTRFTLEAVALEMQQPILVPDTWQEPGWITLPETTWIRSHLAVPIYQGDKALGVLQLDSDSPNAYTLSDANLLEPLSSAAAIALDNARLYEQARQDAHAKSILLREVNHRVGNNLTAISGMLALERRYLSPSEQSGYQSLMKDLTNRINGLATVHNMLSATEWAPLPLDELINRVIHSSLQMLPFDKSVTVDVTPSTIKIPSDQAHHLAIIINELTTNSIKYALTHKLRGHIAVEIAADQGGLTLTYTDDGPGYPNIVLQHGNHNVGLELIDNLVRKNMHGDWQLFNRNGAVTILRFIPETQSALPDYRS